jgi:ferredoxin
MRNAAWVELKRYEVMEDGGIRERLTRYRGFPDPHSIGRNILVCNAKFVFIVTARPRAAERFALRVLNACDAACNRLYGWRGNPLYQSGTIAIVLLFALIATGLWLIVFYRVGSPYASVERITADVHVGRWMRSIHRYATDALVIAVVVHGFRMFAQGRSWGPRTLAWTSGIVMLGLVYVCALTGYVMVWDGFGYRIAQEGARLIDSLPILSEPISRAFTGEQEMMGPFFFLNLFAHIAIPLGLALVLWLHVSRVARPVLLPPRRVAAWLIVAIVGISVVSPVALQPEANAFHLPESIRMDLLVAWWLPVIRRMPAGVALSLAVTGFAILLVLPAFTRRKANAVPPASVVDEDICVGCTQCALDCPYDAIAMLQRPPGGRSELVARVDPDLCVSCGICAGSCAPMSVGPAGRTGRDQLSHVRSFIAANRISQGLHVVVCCGRSAMHFSAAFEAEGAVTYPVDCAGSVHTSVIEMLVRGGSSGVLVLSCPPRDCWNREGPKWLVERMFNEREAELQARVDRTRVRVGHASAGDRGNAVAQLRSFMRDTPALPHVKVELVDPELVCETTVTSMAES